jgi:hypothetical protein
MSSSVDVAVRSDQPTVLARFVEAARTAGADTTDEVETTQAWLAERSTLWQAVACRCQEEVEELTSALKRCRSSAGACCDETERALREAQIRLHGAQAELTNTRQWAPAIAEATRVGDRAARRT